MELAANEAVWADIPAKIWYPDPSELKTLPYRSKKALTGAVRLVKFGGIEELSAQIAKDCREAKAFHQIP